MIRKWFLLIFGFLLLSVAIGFSAAWPTSELLYPVGGEVFHPGQKVNIQWKVINPNNIPVCEQEVYVFINNTRYLVAQLRGNARAYSWIVPNATGAAVIQLNLGCETGNNKYESFNRQNNHPFTIQ